MAINFKQRSISSDSEKEFQVKLSPENHSMFFVRKNLKLRVYILWSTVSSYQGRRKRCLDKKNRTYVGLESSPAVSHNSSYKYRNANDLIYISYSLSLFFRIHRHLSAHPRSDPRFMPSTNFSPSIRLSEFLFIFFFEKKKYVRMVPVSPNETVERHQPK